MRHHGADKLRNPFPAPGLFDIRPGYGVEFTGTWIHRKSRMGDIHDGQFHPVLGESIADTRLLVYFDDSPGHEKRIPCPAKTARNRADNAAKKSRPRAAYRFQPHNRTH